MTPIMDTIRIHRRALEVFRTKISRETSGSVRVSNGFSYPNEQEVLLYPQRRLCGSGY